MTSSTKAVLVLGATGKQGGAVTKHVLAKGWRVRALVRDPQKEAAQTLRSQGIKIVQGDLNHSASVTEAMKGMDGVFSVQSTFDAQEEERQGKMVADAALTVHSFAWVMHLPRNPSPPVSATTTRPPRPAE